MSCGSLKPEDNFTFVCSICCTHRVQVRGAFFLTDFLRVLCAFAVNVLFDISGTNLGASLHVP